MENKYLDNQEYINNTTKRLPVCIVTDISGSMLNKDDTYDDDPEIPRIQRVNDAIVDFYEQQRNNVKTRKAIEVLIIAAGSEPEIIQDFKDTTDNPAEIKARKETCILKPALELALQKLDEQKAKYKKYNINYWQPWLIIMTDGGVFKGLGEEFNDIQEEIRRQEALNKLSVFPVFVQKATIIHSDGTYENLSPKTYDKRLKFMKRFTNDESRVILIDKNQHTNFAGLFKFLSQSASSVTNNKGIIYSKNYSKGSTNSQVFSNIKMNDIYSNAKKVEKEPVEEINPQTFTNEYQNFDLNNSLEVDEYASVNNIIINKPNKVNHKEHNAHPTIKKTIYNIYINDNKVYPPKIHNGDIVIFSVVIHKNDTITIDENGAIIYKDKIDKSGLYNFTINKTEVLKNIQEAKSLYNKKDITESKKEISNYIDKYRNWDNI